MLQNSLGLDDVRVIATGIVTDAPPAAPVEPVDEALEETTEDEKDEKDDTEPEDRGRIPEPRV